METGAYLTSSLKYSLFTKQHKFLNKKKNNNKKGSHLTYCCCSYEQNCGTFEQKGKISFSIYFYSAIHVSL